MKDALARIALRVADAGYDPRHALLDVSGDLLSLEGSQSQCPDHLRAEFESLLSEIRDVQPVFPSQRRTSVLFDREGIGQTGRAQAIRLVQRVRALAAAVENIEYRSS